MIPVLNFNAKYAKEDNQFKSRFVSGRFGDPAGIRTPDPLLKRQLLCRLSYRIIYQTPPGGK